MRPVSLQVKGFTAFRDEQNVDFIDLDLFAISGPTGAGKSSLLDAVTYALFGKIERVGDRCGLLITHGQPRMAVRLDFDLGGSRYRVARSTPRQGATKATLERLDGGEAIALADKVKDVDAGVERLLGIDYMGFTRTVLLPQGKFDQFLAGDRTDRRKILSELLQLGIYDDMQRRANQIARDSRLRAQTTRELLERDFEGVSEKALADARAAERDARKRETALQTAAQKVGKILEKREQARRAASELRACSADLRDDAKAAGETARRLERLAEESESAAGDLRARQKAAADAAGAADRARQALAKAEKANAVAFLTRGLRKGQKCPVCGEPLAKTPHHVDVDLERFAAELEDAEALSAQRERERARAAEAQARAEKAIATERGSLATASWTATVKRVRSVASEDALPAVPAKMPGGDDPAPLAVHARKLESALEAVATRLDAIAKARTAGEETLLAEAIRAVGDLAAHAVSLDLLASTLGSALRRASADIAVAEERAKTIASRLGRKAELEAEVKTTMHRAEVMAALSLDLQQNAIVEYLQAEELRALAADGSRHLAYLSSDRYHLRYHDDEFWVQDTWNNDEERSVRTLSGGETFLASLALALALSQHIREFKGAARPRLDSLFIDEGFGTLDTESLTTVVSAIERLGGDGRLIGVITHVRDLAERFVRIEVEKSQRGSRLRLVA